MLIYDLIIAIYELSQVAFLAWIFVKLIRDSLIPDESFTVVLLVIMAVCAYALSGGVECRADRKSTRLNSSHDRQSRMPSSA